ncbi:MAG TPA: DUF5666 domain-containing protein [Oligoflexia bacterium]|nr:DUF5666 domain-containing protein [Oligoflexia bacterium]HMP49531.1 DUF5666 domain-containing protein [Oligoflexia bacterium]
MKKVSILVVLVGLNLFVFSSVFAHDEKQHKSPQLTGMLVSISGDNIVVETDSGENAVEISAQTIFESGSEGVGVTRNELKKGQFLAIRGHKLASGNFAASSILIKEDHKKGTNNLKTHTQ